MTSKMEIPTQEKETKAILIDDDDDDKQHFIEQIHSG